MDMVVVSPKKVLKSNIPTVAYVQLSQHLVHLEKILMHVLCSSLESSFAFVQISQHFVHLGKVSHACYTFMHLVHFDI